MSCPDLEELRIDACETITGRHVWEVIQSSSMLSAIHFRSFLFEAPFPSREQMHPNPAPELCVLLMESSPNLVHLDLSIFTAHHFQYHPPPAMLARLRHLGIEFVLSEAEYPEDRAIDWTRQVFQSADEVRDLRVDIWDGRIDVEWIMDLLLIGPTDPKPVPNLASFGVTGSEIHP